ncbi:hypothetical protein HPB52_003047 [Rhipicephalus sanguineus]|uniref:Peptidase M13 C-terminal domain-containing protein n=1 Tax=Rhipicephalus sanguineus TaxID=34632 RepID=A0A9D4PIQ0_RHISA|nr:hypothetical protein HPB52_003047 [Rhipicephalus sanguineus]
MSAKAFESHRHDTFFRRSLGILAMLVVLSFVAFVLRPMGYMKGPFSFGANQPAAAIGMSVEAAVFRYRCEQASEDAREAIDYYADPCEDFHAYACDRTRRRDRGELHDERSRLQRVLFQLSLLNDTNHVAVQAAVLFKSCLSMPLSLEVVLQKNMLEFLEVANLSAETMLGFLETPEDVANLSALNSFAHGIRSLASFESGLNGTVVVSFSRPFSAYLNRRSARAVIDSVTQLLDIPKDHTYKASNLLLADQELATLLIEANTFYVTLEHLASATGGRITSSAWKKIVQDYGFHSANALSSAPIVSVERLKQVFTIIFDKLNPQETAVYTIAHALLPTQILEVLFDDHRTYACFRLVSETLGTTWQDLESYLLGFFDENHEAHSVAYSVASTFEKMLEGKFAHDKQNSGVAIAKLKKLRFDMPSVEGLANFVPSTACRGNLSEHSLYRNLMRCKESRQNAAAANNAALRRRKRSSLATSSILLSVESFRPSSFCHGHDSLLNYATLGTELAATLLRYVAGPLDGAAVSHSTAEWKKAVFPGITANISTCLSRSSRSSELGRLLDDVALQTVAFQVALRASKSQAGAWARIEKAPDAPAWKQTYFVKYCQSLCNDDKLNRSAATLDVALACNSVVMNSPEFAQLFRCERGDPMVPSEYCMVL